jgi:hypothetical protein
MQRVASTQSSPTTQTAPSTANDTLFYCSNTSTESGTARTRGILRRQTDPATMLFNNRHYGFDDLWQHSIRHLLDSPRTCPGGCLHSGWLFRRCHWVHCNCCAQSSLFALQMLEEDTPRGERSEHGACKDESTDLSRTPLSRIEQKASWRRQ